MLVSKEFRFEASHILPNHKGKCSRLHGHSWRVRVEVYGEIDDASGFVLDYAELKKIVQPLIDLFDHRHLNCFVNYPSSENIACYLAHQLLDGLYYKSKATKMVVAVSETESTWAVWDSNNSYDWERIQFSPTAKLGWQSPGNEISCTDVPVTIAYLEKILPELRDTYFERLMTLEQLRLYAATMTPLDPLLRSLVDKKGEENVG